MHQALIRWNIGFEPHAFCEEAQELVVSGAVAEDALDGRGDHVDVAVLGVRGLEVHRAERAFLLIELQHYDIHAVVSYAVGVLTEHESAWPYDDMARDRRYRLVAAECLEPARGRAVERR